MRIQVTADDIAKGQRNDCTHCPLARALRRATGRLHVVCPAFVVAASTHREVPLPPEASKFVREYDRNREVEPFEFDLDVMRVEEPR